ncbi:hypothetical protein [Myxococcus virescens]|uniref:Uncharacterized protein n=1 Tax=Myxococcus virescens TaxID=83456 RepID=A0A511HRN6_9BACT|nr:hypothetical protein [Myxococcus virescens]GEL75159.1 hypothetical protein MVI01_69430 [Myxococcus virescens]
MKSFKCVECGRGMVVPLAKPGRRMAFKHIPDLEVPADLELPTCTACGTEWLDEDSTRALDMALARVYRMELSKKANAALRRLKTAKFRQWDLEPLLGLSPGYLSKVKAGKDISPTLTAALVLLAEEPTRVDELRNNWRCVPEQTFRIRSESSFHLELPKGPSECSYRASLWSLLNELDTDCRPFESMRLSFEPEPEPVRAATNALTLEATA